MFNVPGLHMIDVRHDGAGRLVVAVEIGLRAKLTTRVITWATEALAHDDTAVAALARHLGLDWHTCWAMTLRS